MSVAPDRSVPVDHEVEQHVGGLSPPSARSHRGGTASSVLARLASPAVVKAGRQGEQRAGAAEGVARRGAADSFAVRVS
jgi:hypothetical protein